MTRNGPALVVNILLFLGRQTIANFPGNKASVIVSGVICLDSLARYFALACCAAA